MTHILKSNRTSRLATNHKVGLGCGGLTPDALKKIAEEHKSCQMKTTFHSGLVCLGNNKLGSLRQSNTVWCVANWTGTLTLVSGISAEGSVTLETLKVFMQFVQS